jgi:KaiC/GvpD/RAD55 family RecA-like ATPase
MHNFDRKGEGTGARVNQKVADVAERMERETAELISYLNNEVVPAIRAHSTKALRVAADKLARMADYLDEQKRTHL